MKGSSRSIVLIGFMGAGKSSVGHELEHLTGVERYDTDEVICTRFSLPITEVFARFGEEKFREAETEALLDFPPGKKAIIITGGGLILREQNVVLIKRLGIVVYLAADESILFSRIKDRTDLPLLKTQDPRETVTRLLKAREPLYAAAADIRIDTTNLETKVVAGEVLARVDELCAQPS